MFRHFNLRLQHIAKKEYRSLSEWLTELAQIATRMSKCERSTLANSNGKALGETKRSSSEVPLETSNVKSEQLHEKEICVEELWESITQCSRQACALREVDTLFSIVQCLCGKRQFPTKLESWVILAERLLLYSDVEMNAVLHYPGIPDAQLRLQTHMSSKSSSNPSIVADNLAHITDNNIHVMEKQHHHDESNNEKTDALFGVNDSNHTLLSSNVHCRDVIWQRLAHQQRSRSRQQERINDGITNDSNCHLTSSTKVNYETYQLFPSRETLLMTNGVIPLSSRAPCADGQMISLFISAFTDALKCELCEMHKVASSRNNNNGTYYHPEENNENEKCKREKQILEVLHAMNAILLNVLSRNMKSIHFEFVLVSLTQYMQLLHWVDVYTSKFTNLSKSGTGNATQNRDVCNDAELQQSQKSKQVLQEFVSRLCDEVTVNILGPRIVLHYLTNTFCNSQSELTLMEHYANKAQSNSTTRSNNSNYVHKRISSDIDIDAEVLKLELIKHVVESIYKHFHRHYYNCELHLSQSVQSVSSQLQTLFDDFDLLLQYNANQNNPMQLAHEVEESIRVVITLALLRALRMESSSAEEFLRSAIPLVDRCPAAMRVEAEIIFGKAKLLSHFTLEERAREIVYDDLVRSLQNMVELRPRKGIPHTNDSVSVEHNNKKNMHMKDNENSNKECRSGGGAVFSLRDVWKWKGNANCETPTGLDEETQQIMQKAHACVITALCQSNNEARISEAYGIVISHKYHGLVVNTEIIHPLLSVLSKSGDGRAFNLIDICVLYSNCCIDMQTIVYLVHTCAVAGDYYRARGLVALLKDIYPGFLLAAPDSVREELRELKVLNPIPANLFASEEEKMVHAMLNDDKRSSLRTLPDNTSIHDKYVK